MADSVGSQSSNKFLFLKHLSNHINFIINTFNSQIKGKSAPLQK